ncbi:p26 protein [Thysanoplusia orichalcea nucleopolyhedrovirus]|uniref:p26 protein n=1 Tax=Thysanoplusia orichalcea nucleopolyhedrovirus TaxID=101850 RepID=L0CJW6_9ABAC|nr:p26 protein [Thysanoplusia orichalcea nucleopolyhedrovirus]AGA16284.1 p26 protein [Thysanoplusia orichalcea nucleopolyhedrovirus]
MAKQVDVMEEVYNVKCTTDSKKMEIKQIDDVDAFVQVIEPGQEVFNETFNEYHQFPGVVSSIVFPQLALDTIVNILTEDGSLHTAKLNHTCFNFHVCNKRFVFGNLPAAIVNGETKRKLRIGAPIFANETLVSVVTAFHRIDENEWMLPVTGIREATQFSGHMKVLNGVCVEKWRPNMSVYGTVQLPYDKIKQHAVEQKLPPMSAPESCVLFYKESEIRITFNRGDYEIIHFRLPGPLVQPSITYYN